MSQPTTTVPIALRHKCEGCDKRFVPVAGIEHYEPETGSHYCPRCQLVLERANACDGAESVLRAALEHAAAYIAADDLAAICAEYRPEPELAEAS